MRKRDALRLVAKTDSACEPAQGGGIEDLFFNDLATDGLLPL